MTRVLTVPGVRPSLYWFTVFALTLIVALPLSTRGATLTEDAASRFGPEGVAGDAGRERLVVVPEPGRQGWGEWHDGWHDGGPRIDVWVDRGDWATYRPGDRLLVFFRVDRPCCVTIIDYAPDGRVDLVYPNRWSGSTMARPGRTYRVPESRLYSLRIAGSGGVETLVACAHQAPWPSGPHGPWIPPFGPRRGRVVVGRSGGGVPPGRPGRVVSPRGAWPVPEEWSDRPSDWGCDSVSFHVVDDAWRGGPRNAGSQGEVGVVFRDGFVMDRCSDSFSRDLYVAGRSAVIRIECTESRSGDPTEVVGRVMWGDGRDGEPLFRIDADGRHGERPAVGTVYAESAGPIRVEVEVIDFDVDASNKPWTPARIDWIRFEVRAFVDR